ncbi:MAG: tetratricopeptide repeat protein, partial [Sandaracinaceae bacterium]|nr:tetratricopeptide repeat protein [Sandaracinaceae bacterium]
MADVEEEIGEMKRETIEIRAMVIKISNTLSALGADVKTIARRQANYEQRISWNSWVAYVLFALLSFLGLWLAKNASVSAYEEQVERLKRRVEELQRELSEETQRAEVRARAEAKALQFYHLIRERRKEEVVEQYPEIRKELLSAAEAAFFRDMVDRFQEDLSFQAYHNGLDLMRTGRYAEAAESFQEALRLREDAPHGPAVRLELARALRHLGQEARAKDLAAEVAEQTIDRELQDDALLLFAECAEAVGAIDEARAALRTYLRRWPRGAYASEVRKRLSQLNRQAMRSASREAGTTP